MKASVRLVRFATIGTLNYLITMLVIWIVMSYFSFKGKYIVANIMAYLIAQTHNFIWSKYWIFPSSNPQNSLLATNNALLYRFWYCLWHTTSFCDTDDRSNRNQRIYSTIYWNNNIWSC